MVVKFLEKRIVSCVMIPPINTSKQFFPALTGMRMTVNNNGEKELRCCIGDSKTWGHLLFVL